MNALVKKFVFVSLFGIFYFVSQPLIAGEEGTKGEVVVTIIDTKDGVTAATEKTFPNQASADLYLEENGYGELSLKATKKSEKANRKVKIRQRTLASNGIVNLKTGEPIPDKIVYYPAHATVKDLPSGGKEISWNEIDEKGTLSYLTTTVRVHNKGGF